MRRLSTSGLAADVWAVLLTAYLLWPLHSPGYGLGRDMVFTPHQPLNASSIGVGSGTPRAVPLDALVALAGHVFGGAATGRLAMLLPLVAAGWGARRLVATPNLGASLVTSGFAVWNPFVVERLALGQWALLWAYGALPWLVLVSHRLRANPGRNSERVLWSGAILALAAAAITPTGALVGGAALVTLTACGRTRTTLRGLVLAVAAQLPWLVPSLLSSAAATSDPAAVTVFAAKAEHAGGVFATLLSLGGIWDRDATPASRSGALGLLTLLVVLLALGLGLRQVFGRLGATVAGRLTGLALAGLGLAGLAAVPGGDALLRWAARTVPGAGLLRDGQKWLLAFVLLAVLCVGALVAWVADHGRSAAVVAAVLGLTLPAILLPDAARTLVPTITPATYPSDWYSARAYLDAQPDGGAVLVLPFASYRRFDWARASSVIDPVPRWVDRDVLGNDQLVVSGRVLAGEDRRVAAIGRVLASDRAAPRALAAQLADHGIGWVWVETDTPGPELPDLTGLARVRAGRTVTLYRVPGAIASDPASTGEEVVVILADLLLAALVLAAACVVTAAGVQGCYTRRGRTQSEDET